MLNRRPCLTTVIPMKAEPLSVRVRLARADAWASGSVFLSEVSPIFAHQVIVTFPPLLSGMLSKTRSLTSRSTLCYSAAATGVTTASQ